MCVWDVRRSPEMERAKPTRPLRIGDRRIGAFGSEIVLFGEIALPSGGKGMDIQYQINDRFGFAESDCDTEGLGGRVKISGNNFSWLPDRVFRPFPDLENQIVLKHRDLPGPKAGTQRAIRADRNEAAEMARGCGLGMTGRLIGWTQGDGNRWPRA